MKHFHFASFGLALLISVAAAEAASRSAVLTLPAGGAELHAVFTAAQDLLEHDYTITKAVVDHRLETSDTVYDSVSAVSSATAKSILTWTLEFHTEADGRTAVSIHHTAEGHRPPESLVQFARDLAAAAKAGAAGATLELNGVRKPLADWKRP